jgi:hypothetical protein
MVNDPLVVALATALEGLLTRGLSIQPCGDGWTIKLAQEVNQTDSGQTPEPEEVRRSW